MEIKVKLNAIIIKDENDDKKYIVKTLRSAKEISEYLQESEKDIIQDKLEEEVNKQYNY